MSSNREDGFTIVELITAITVASVMVGVLFVVTFRFFANAIQSQQTAELALESQTLLSQMTEDLRLGAGVRSANQLPDSNQPSGGWAASDANNVFIITTPAITTSRDIIYDANTGFPYENEIIYFVSNKTMYKRSLRNTAATGNSVTTSCPSAQVTASCPEDRIFSTNVDNITYTLYDASNTVTTNAALARSVELTVFLSKNVFGKTVSLSNSARITQRNL